jgi:hypothetical protein
MYLVSGERALEMYYALFERRQHSPTPTTIPYVGSKLSMVRQKCSVSDKSKTQGIASTRYKI